MDLIAGILRSGGSAARIDDGASNSCGSDEDDDSGVAGIVNDDDCRSMSKSVVRLGVDWLDGSIPDANDSCII